LELRDAAVLVVDDEPFLLEIFAEWIEEQGCGSLYTAENGAEALRIEAANHIDLIVSDVRMPVMDGVALLKALRAKGSDGTGRPNMPKLIFITGFSDLAPREAYDLGVDAILQKPVEREEFLATILRVLRPYAPRAVRDPI
jgi:CheY-like chemotaxis protein